MSRLLRTVKEGRMSVLENGSPPAVPAAGDVISNASAFCTERAYHMGIISG